MNGNLIVVMGKTIVFSTALQKPNSLPTFVGWQDLVDPRIGRLTIPIGFESLFITSSYFLSDKNKTEKIAQGPVCIDVVDGSVCENYSQGTDIVVNTIPLSGDSFYCRSNNGSLESAATAGYFLYDDPVKIYREAFKACSINTHYFFKGDISTISKYLTDLSTATIDLEKATEEEKTQAITFEEYDKKYEMWKNFTVDQGPQMGLKILF